MNNNHSASPPFRVAKTGESIELRGAVDVSEIIRYVADRSGHDLGQYRQGLLARRLERRARECRLGGLADYAWMLRRSPAELDTLLPCLLGRVSRFFRAPAQLAVLRSLVLEPLLSHQRGEEPLRVWTIGCGTGEEAYSIAMLLLEAKDDAPASSFQVLATDSDSRRVDGARLGDYPQSIGRLLSAGRLARFFVRQGPGYRVNELLRSLVHFEARDVGSDPLPAPVDVIICRDLLDSLRAAPRRDLLARLRASLKPGGTLLLGPSEARPTPACAFSILDAHHRVFVRTAYDGATAEVGERAGDGPSRSAQLEAVNRDLRGRLEELVGANEDMRTLLGSTRIAILLNPDLCVRSFTRATSGLFEISDADRGRRIEDLPRRFACADLEGAILGGLQEGGEEEVLADDGRWFAMRSLAYRTPMGAVAGLILTFVDVTARKAAEDALVRSQDFVASVSHEIRGPVHAIIGYADILCEAGVAAQSDPLAGIRRIASGLLDLVGLVLDWARLDHSRRSGQVARVPVATLLAEIIEEIEVGLGTAAPRIRGRLAPELPDLFSDALKLKVALRNLIGNAVKHGNSDVEVDVRAVRDGLEFSISDRGVGVHPAEPQRTFEPFRRGTGVERAEMGNAGVGLGLHLTRALIEGLGGSIEVEREPARGATFRLWLPGRPEVPGEPPAPGGGA